MTRFPLIIIVIISILIASSLSGGSGIQQLRFDEKKGEFKILQVADMHYFDGSKTPCEDVLPQQFPHCSDLKTTFFIERMIEVEKPDLIVFTGDNIYGTDTTDPVASMNAAFAPAVASNIPWAAVLGNHDQESGVRVNALYSTPSIYTDAKLASNMSWPLKTDDYFPYADGEDSYWTGYFTSCPALKRYIRSLSGYYLALRQLEYMAGRRSRGPNTFSLGDALGISQHHDAVTGTLSNWSSRDFLLCLVMDLIFIETALKWN